MTPKDQIEELIKVQDKIRNMFAERKPVKILMNLKKVDEEITKILNKLGEDLEIRSKK